MEERLPEDKLSALLPALSLLAERIGAGEVLEHSALREVLLDVGINEQAWAIEHSNLLELEKWTGILKRARDSSSESEDALVVEEFRARGIPEFNAILACHSAKPRPLPVEPSSLSREELDNILRSSDYTPDKLIEFFRPDFGKEFVADAGVWEKYTVERHILMVMHQFEKYFSRGSLPSGFNVDTFRVILALHDIGVSAAIEEGTKRGMEIREAKKIGQPIYTSKLMGSAMENLGFDRKEIDVAKALVSDDPIGSYLRSGIFTTASIRGMARQSGMPVLDFFDLLLVFYMVDASSYTEDAGGQKSLDFLFVFDKHQMKMAFSPETLNKISKLRKSLEWS